MLQWVYLKDETKTIEENVELLLHYFSVVNDKLCRWPIERHEIRQI